MGMTELRSLSGLLQRIRNLGGAAMFGGKRNFETALGYAEDLTYEMYRRRYERGGIASRIVEVYPDDTWRDGAEILENTDATRITAFEAACADLMERIQIWPVLQRADILAGIGEYAVILIGAPGESLADEMPKGSGTPDGIAYLNAYAEGNTKIAEYETDERNPRFGQPRVYELVNLMAGSATATVNRKVHWSRIIHLADGVLDNPLRGMPRLKKVWNDLDNLEKVVGGGSEAFWKSVYQGMQVDVDKEMELDDDSLKDLQEQMDEFEHNMRRIFKTRGVKVNALGADVSDFNPQAHTILDLICGTIKCPKRIFLGSERGELASSQDRENWNDRIANRQKAYAFPFVVKPLVERLLAYNYLPKPSEPFFVRWSLASTLSLKDKAEITERLSKTNTNLGETVVTAADLRDKVLGWDALSDEDIEDRLWEEDDEVEPTTPDTVPTEDTEA